MTSETPFRRTKLELPSAVCQAYGQFAYQDEQKGVDAIAMIQEYFEECQHEMIRPQIGIETTHFDSQAKHIRVERDRTGKIIMATSVGLPNMLINLKALLKELTQMLSESMNLLSIVNTFISGSLIEKMIAVLAFLQFARELATIELKPEHAGVLIALHSLARGKLQLEISLSELQIRMEQDYRFALTPEQINEILEDLVDLHCIIRGNNIICLIEKIIITDK